MIRITSPSGSSAATPVAPVDAAPAASAVAAGARHAHPPLQSAVLGPAMAALQAMPETDLARITALRDALLAGRLPFDAERLAGAVQRFHGGRG